ncbi:hemerythrin domain-containing protein [Kribbella sp. NPDC003505]|uniref:hemerythrin domain-containing protein n=1 Tax=Kribbella sp. NPDC003505 TaxID=3154448 RepID=UPI0033BD83B5
MCEHCGCREIEPIARLMDEHLEMRELSGQIRRSLLAGDRATAEGALALLGARLVPHARREERGLFTALEEQGDFADEVRRLEADHRAFDEILDELDATAPDFEQRVTALLADLSLHIDREDLGIFPVSVVTLGAEGWETVERAHAEKDETPTPAH